MEDDHAAGVLAAVAMAGALEQDADSFSFALCRLNSHRHSLNCGLLVFIVERRLRRHERRHEPVNRTAGGAIWRRGRRVVARSPRHHKPSSALADDTQAGGAVWRTRTRAARNVTGMHRRNT